MIFDEPLRLYKVRWGVASRASSYVLIKYIGCQMFDGEQYDLDIWRLLSCVCLDNLELCIWNPRCQFIMGWLTVYEYLVIRGWMSSDALDCLNCLSWISSLLIVDEEKFANDDLDDTICDTSLRMSSIT